MALGAAGLFLLLALSAVFALPKDGSEALGPASPVGQPHAPRPVVAEPAPAPGAPALAAAPDVAVAVDASLGPHGGAPVMIDRRLYGMNIADWEEEDYRPDPEPVFTAFLGALKPGILRWPAGDISQDRVWERSPRAEKATRLLTTEHVDDFLDLARAVKAEPVIAVNIVTGTPAEAADLVRYVNVEKDYGVRWWQIGNEPDMPGAFRSPSEYARTFLRFERAMRDVDPSIQLVGGELMTGAHIIGSNGAEDWLTPILRRAGEQMDAISWHYYPLDSKQTNPNSPAAPNVGNLLQERAGDWRPAGLAFADEVFPALHRARGTYAPGAEMWVTEFGEDPSNGGLGSLSATHASALWTAEVLGRFAAHGADAMAKFVFKSGKDHNFTLLDADNAPRPSYYVYWLYANEFGNRMVNVTSDQKALVNGHAALREDGRLSVLLVNKDTAPHEASLSLAGFEGGAARAFVVQGDSLDAREVTLNGETLDVETVGGPGAVQGVPIDVGPGTGVALPPLSVTLLVIDPV